jgi:hypothetical protein
VVNRAELVKSYPEVQRYLRDTRAGLVQDIAGDEENLSEMQRLLIDRIISKLSVCRIIECYLEKHGILRRDRLEKDKVLELEPALVQWAAIDRNIKDALALLGINRRASAEPDVLTYIDAFDAKKAAREAQEAKEGASVRLGGPTIDVQGKTIEGADIVAGDSGGPTGTEINNKGEDE